MSDPTRRDVDALIKMEVDRAVAPYVNKVPKFMLKKLRELAERHWRESPTAIESIRRRVAKGQIQSGTEAKVDPAVPAAPAADPTAAEGDLGKKEDS